MITNLTIANQVRVSLGEWQTQFDIDGIVAEIIQKWGRVNIDTITPYDYEDLLERHSL